MRRIVSGDQGQSRYVEGGCSIFQTTANPETKSRFFILGVDESREQTRRILAMHRKSHTLEGLKDQSNKEGIIRKHHSFQRLLEPYAVVTPCAEELFYEDDRLQARRDQPKFLDLCKAVAFLNQMKKPLKNYNGIDYIEVSREDIQQATENSPPSYWESPLMTSRSPPGTFSNSYWRWTGKLSPEPKS